MAKNKKAKKKSFGAEAHGILSVFDPHHVIQRQFLITGVSIALMGSAFIYSNLRQNAMIYHQEMLVSPSGQQMAFSKSTDTTVTLGKIQLSSDQKTMFIPLTFNSLAKVGNEANLYTTYMADGNGPKSPMQYQVSGQLILYTLPNQAVLVVHSSTKIQSEPIEMIIMNHGKGSKNIPDATADSDADNQDSDSQTLDFGNSDAVAFKINPGAKDVVDRTRINPDIKNLSEVYSAVFASKQEQDIQDQIKKDQQTIQSNEKQLPSLVNRLKQLGFDVPKTPYYVSPDWKSSMFVNEETGKTKSGLSGNDQSVKSFDPAKNISLPTTLSSKSGAKMTQNSDGLAEWQGLTQSWDNIKKARIDMEITQQYNLYHTRIQNDQNKSQSNGKTTIADPSKFKQLSPVAK